ncbi:hypothetical protein RchiOBHm_Chr5g0052061 [Rosa chinensis]|uniref:Uncharacterized protein n=1 Tax=Rosa chinensis TaxID=74649 RepID=A0A2P6QFK6_ROSCH|nr:hypothetical protein RchiOBHm_Chr5g0052061 [Rosa chinensis]
MVFEDLDSYWDVSILSYTVGIVYTLFVHSCKYDCIITSLYSKSHSFLPP